MSSSAKAVEVGPVEDRRVGHLFDRGLGHSGRDRVAAGETGDEVGHQAIGHHVERCGGDPAVDDFAQVVAVGGEVVQAIERFV